MCPCVQQIHTAGTSPSAPRPCTLGSLDRVFLTQRKVALLCEYQNLYNEYFGPPLVTLMLYGIVHLIQALFVVCLLVAFPGTPSLSSPAPALVTQGLLTVAAATLIAVICDVATPVTDQVRS